MADLSIQESQLSVHPWMAAASFQLSLWKKSRTGEMTTNCAAEQGKKLFAIGVVLFGQGLAWSVGRPHPIFSRAEMLIGITLAAYGMLLWRSAFRKLSLANYIIVLSCAPVLFLCVSKMSEWVYFLNQQRGYSTLNDLGVGAIELTMVICIIFFGAWWADSTFIRARYHQYKRSSRFVK
jgi:hypothetical protein